MRCFPSALDFGQVTTRFMKFLHFLLSSLVENKMPPVSLIFFIFPTEIAEFSFNCRCTIGWPAGHLHRVCRKSENLHFDGLRLSKAYKNLDEKVQKSYVSWHWRVMQSLKKIWFLVLKMTWRIWWILMRVVASLKTFTLMCYFCRKYIIFEPKRCVMKNDFRFQKWHQKFGEFSQK